MSWRHHIPMIVIAFLVSAGVALAPPAGAQDSESTAPARTLADSSQGYGEPSSMYNAHRITRVINEGTHVVLADGTIWEIYLPDRPAVNSWRPGDLLIVRESSVTQGEYDYRLSDGRTRGAVYARLVGEVPGRG